MKKLTKEQLKKAHKKLAIAYGRWNAPDGDRNKKTLILARAIYPLVKKTGYFQDYQKAIRKQSELDQDE